MAHSAVPVDSVEHLEKSAADSEVIAELHLSEAELVEKPTAAEYYLGYLGLGELDPEVPDSD